MTDIEDKKKENKSLRPAPPPLPATVSELDALLTYKQRKTIIDYAGEVNDMLWEDPEYRKYWNAIFKEQAITGSVDGDQFVAAQMVKAKAREMGMVQLQNEKETAIRKALRRHIFGRHKPLKEQREAALLTKQDSLFNEEGPEG
jgi:hypothetical protein